MARRMREHDWSATPLGEPAQWPASLRTMVAMMLSTRHPAFIFWGPELRCLYNDAYSVSLGPEKHPGILGMPGKQAFPEIWPIVGADIEGVLAGGPATWHENQLVPIQRNGRLEDVYWTYSYAGIDDSHAPNGVGGVLVLCNETTGQVLERQKTQSDLSRLALLFEQAPIFIAVLSGPEHRFTFANPSYQRLVGQRDLLDRTVAQALPEVVDQGFIRLLDGVYASGQPYAALAAEVNLKSATIGTVQRRRLDFVYQPTRNAAGEVDGILVVGVDVTERLDAEKALEVSEEQLRLATEASDVGLWDVDHVAETLYWPPRLRHMFGIFSDRPVTLQDDFYNGLHPDDREAVAVAYNQARDPVLRAVYDVEYRTVGREDGLVRWVAAKGRGVFNAQGECVRVIGTAVDITGRKRDEAKLRELNETLEQRLTEFLAERKLFADIVEGTDALIQVVSPEFRILAINRACADEFERVYGRRPQVGDHLLELLDPWPDHQAEVRAAWTRALDGDAFVDELEFGEASLSRRWYELHFHPLFASDGRRIGAYQFVYEITARREAEARLARTEAALIQAQKMESLGLLTGGVAHDFNNLLQALNTRFELIRRRPEDQAHVHKWATSGVEVAQRGARLTAQLLTFSRRQAPDVRAVRLSALLDSMRDLLRTTLGPTLDCVIDCPDLWVLADATQMEMALLNLAINARDAMVGPGRFTIAVRAGATPDQVEIRAIDTGTGMSEAVIAKAFEPFFTTKGIGKGSGLGLAQVYSMADRAGGSVRIESDGRTGTSVIVTLRRASPPTDTATPALPLAIDGATVGTDILVVDDDDHVRSSLVALLRGAGHRVTEANGGEAALTILEQHPVDLLLCDFAMPGMNGVAVANLARATRPALRVVLMSGYADGNELRDAIGHGMTLLRKPFDAGAVQHALASATARH